ncbi:hypothetical protein D3C79_859620 [compost metagenome]
MTEAPELIKDHCSDIERLPIKKSAPKTRAIQLKTNATAAQIAAITQKCSCTLYLMLGTRRSLPLAVLAARTIAIFLTLFFEFCTRA